MADSPFDDAGDAAGARDRAHFERIAGAWTKKDLAPATRIARRQRLERTLATAPLDRTFSVLEAGCGAGFTADYLGPRAHRYVGVDQAEALIGAARRRVNDPSRHFLATSLDALEPVDAVPENGFDVVLMIGVLHHLSDPIRDLERLMRFLKPGGFMLANEPQPANPMIRGARAIRTRVDPDYTDAQDQLSAATLGGLYRRAGLADVSIVPQGLFSTPFAEVVLPLQPLWVPFSHLACLLDTLLERTIPRVLMRRVLMRRVLRHLSWNLVAAGRKPTRTA